MLAATAAAALTMTAVACSPGPDPAPGAGSGPSAEAPAEEQVLSLGLPTDSLAFATLYLADVLGFFEQAGVTVNRDIVAGVATTQLASGQLDAIVTGASAALPIIEQGRPVQLPYGILYGAPTGVVVTEGSPLTTLEDMAGKRIAVLSATGIGAGVMASINNHLKDQGLEPMEIMVVSDNAAMTGLLESGQVDALGTAYDAAASQLTSGRYRFLYSGTSPDRVMIPGLDKPIIATTVQALQTTLEAKPEAFARFAAALQAADEWAASATSEEVVDQLMKVAGFQAYERDVLVNMWEYFEPILGPSGPKGDITRADWEGTLVAMESFGLGLDLQDPKFSYDNVVNMTPIEDGRALDISFEAP